ncbi:nicotinate-nucleotide adenylyltransferase [Melioribacteraceae bacterium 4301-Me]|uniref:nicotinate-nucleotide adenylyltransferase n=1 Tax=Pyranulibacter aquaticus TaxID=3163344 RepID=UPI00359A917D
MKPIGIYGGTFDPIHIGHLICAQVVLEKRNLEKIFFVPCKISPFKQNEKPTEDKHRLEMIKLSITNSPHFDFSDYEINNERVSYTIDTIKEFKKYYQNIELIIGYDNLVLFDKWKEPDKILELAKLIVMKRVNEIPTKGKHKYFDKAILVDTPTIEISSTEIRNRIKRRLTINYLVPEAVKEYIYNNKLYI